ncbi:hypothetical protein pah_c045o119 [Parachlamydia acanthamoebae str. Hall's coccus]|nr:hypothetical protein pah_c045o119 [Parachlamydia acanthamoebae str. Hall's coccus]
MGKSMTVCSGVFTKLYKYGRVKLEAFLDVEVIHGEEK